MKKTITVEEPWETFKRFLAAKNLRVTNQRKAIFQVAFNSTKHFTAEELLAEARKIDSSVSRATVYRSLPILVESGLIREVDIGRDYKYYRSSQNETTFQAQVICLDCDKIFEIDAPFMEWYGQAVAEKLELKAVSQRLQVEAHCRKETCANKLKASKDN
jgi:Fur family transcriptional regulator, ferric uptake regulator